MAVLRMAGLPGRCVSGYLVPERTAEPGASVEEVIGGQASIAWVEVFIPGLVRTRPHSGTARGIAARSRRLWARLRRCAAGAWRVSRPCGPGAIGRRARSARARRRRMRAPHGDRRRAAQASAARTRATAAITSFDVCRWPEDMCFPQPPARSTASHWT